MLLKNCRSVPSAFISGKVLCWLAEELKERRTSKPRKHRFQVLIPQMPAHGFTKHLAEISGQRQIASFVELFRSKSRPAAVNLASFHRPAENEHHVRMAVISSPVAILACCASELCHG